MPSSAPQTGTRPCQREAAGRGTGQTWLPSRALSWPFSGARTCRSRGWASAKLCAHSACGAGNWVKWLLGPLSPETPVPCLPDACLCTGITDSLGYRVSWNNGPRLQCRKSCRCGDTPSTLCRAAWGGTGNAGIAVGHHPVQGFDQDVRQVVGEHLGADEDFAELGFVRPPCGVLRSGTGAPERDISGKASLCI